MLFGGAVVLVEQWSRSGYDEGLGRNPLPPLIEPFKRIAFTVGDDPATYCALLADTEAARQQGMQQRKDLGGYDAMVFSWIEGDQTTEFINHFVPIDLDIGWYAADGKLVSRTTMDACPEGVNCPTYGATAPYRYAVETPAGGLDDLGLTTGTLNVGGACG